MGIDVNDLDGALGGRSELFAFLKERLRWPVESGDAEFPLYEESQEVVGRAAARANLHQFVPFGASDPFALFLVEFLTDFKRGDLREILRGIRREIRERAAYRNRSLDELVFVCTVPARQGVSQGAYAGLRFVHFEEREGKQPRLRAFGFDRRDLPETYTLRRVNLPALVYPDKNLLDEPDWQEGEKRWLGAWDVEKVTREFFKDYKRIFEEVRDNHISGVKGDKQLFTQRLFNRLMFIHFLSKKGWLRFAERSDYLFALRDRAKASGENLFRDRLYWAFFSGLGVQAGKGASAETHSMEQLVALRGEVPYLNGGLFEMDDVDDVQGAVSIENEAFDKILDGLFRCYNFTIAESTPDDQEVAVDPEMLGKVFEELVTGRHETGSYYTPRPVVAFMCREALKGHLASRVGTGDEIARFVDAHDASGLSDPEAVLAALKAFTVVDPACGSGAYLLGMLQELMTLRQILFAAKKLDAKTLYERKLEIIQRSLYGVDKDLFAVHTARLRLWLSLVVDDTRNPLDDPTARDAVALPNLDFKIECGDSLTALDPQASKGTLSGETLRRFARAKRDYGDPRYTGDKTALKAEIAELKSEIALWEGRPANADTDTFDWRVEFAEVFAEQHPEADLGGKMNLGGTLAEPALPGGFDAVLANPPYVRADAQFKHLKPDEAARQAAIKRWKEYREELKDSRTYSTLYEKWDLYIPFLERAHQLLAPSGQMVFIIPDSYNANKYTAKSHDLFLRESRIERIDFCTDIPLFDAGVTNTILHFAKDVPGETHAPVRARRFGQNKDDFEKNVEMLPTMPQIEFGETLFKMSGERNEAATEGTVPLENICYISVGMVLHADERKAHGEFTAADLILETKDKTHPKPFFEGKNLSRWVVNGNRYLEYGTERAPALFRRPTFPQLYEVPEKLVSMDLSGASLRVVYDDRRLFHNHSAWSFVLWHYLKGVRNKSIKKTARYSNESKGNSAISISRERLEEMSRDFSAKYLLGVMNSEFAKIWVSRQRRNKMHIYPDDWKQLPIVPAPKEEQEAIAALVQKCLDKKGVGCEVEEAEINARIAALYGL